MTTINNLEDLVRVLDENPQWAEALRARILTRELLELPERFARFVESVDARFAQVDARFARIEVDMGYLKGAYARNVARENATTIARRMGLRRVRNLTQDDLWDLTDNADTSALTGGELDSFHRADLVMESTDAQGEVSYIAVGISFTVNGRDTTRAIRNAQLLRDFTGRNAYAAVAGLRKDDRIQGVLDSGDVFWYQMDTSELEAE